MGHDYIFLIFYAHGGEINDSAVYTSLRYFFILISIIKAKNLNVEALVVDPQEFQIQSRRNFLLKIEISSGRSINGADNIKKSSCMGGGKKSINGEF